MLKKLLPVLSLFLMSTTFADVPYNHLTISMAYIGYSNWDCIGPTYRLNYVISNIDADRHDRDPLNGELKTWDPITKFHDIDGNVRLMKWTGDEKITAHVKITDPYVNGRTVWESDIQYSKAGNLSVGVSQADRAHYQIRTSLSYPYFKIEIHGVCPTSDKSL